MYYMDREGHRIKKTTSQDEFLKFVYTHTATRVLMRPLLLPAVSRLGGKLLNTKVSAVFAGLFARTHGIDLNKYQATHQPRMLLSYLLRVLPQQNR